jgi:DNA-binding response OmpR family regulator
MEPNTQFAPRVLLAIDDLRLRRTSEAGLRSAGFAVSVPGDADAATDLARSFAPDVMVIDTDMHGDDDRPLYQQLRNGNDGYLLCIDAAGRDRVRVELLRSGADDAVSVPVTPDEIAARCHALMRRPREIRTPDDESVQPSVITLGPLTVDTSRHEIRLGDDEVQATRIEFSLLEHLCRRPTDVASRSELLASVWGPNWDGDTHVVDVHLSNLRRKLDRAATRTGVIHTVRGIGFRISNEILDAAQAQTVTGTPVAMRPESANGEEPEPACADDTLAADDTSTGDDGRAGAGGTNGVEYAGSSIAPGTIIG